VTLRFEHARAHTHTHTHTHTHRIAGLRHVAPCPPAYMDPCTHASLVEMGTPDRSSTAGARMSSEREHLHENKKCSSVVRDSVVRHVASVMSVMAEGNSTSEVTRDVCLATSGMRPAGRRYCTEATAPRREALNVFSDALGEAESACR
jgi:hypothetical protein